MSEDLIFTLFYLILCFFLIYPPVEFISAGFTVESISRQILGREEENFAFYHIKRSIVTLIIYTWLPLGYVSILFLTGNHEKVTALFFSDSFIWKCFSTFAVILPVLGALQVQFWMRNNYKRHPIVVNLSKYCNNSSPSWENVASDIAREFRTVDKICIQTSAITKVIATENWLLKVSPFTIQILHQSDASLTVKNVETHNISHNPSQFVSIEVTSGRPNVDSFTIRINSTDFRDLQDRISRLITILPNVKFHKTVMERFVDCFKETISANVRYEASQELVEQCIGCMQNRPNVKLQKLCPDDNTDNCTVCYCRPLWCVDCMAKWFASRQDSERQDTWLSSKCTCPMCRAKFCILDVCFLANDDND